MSDGYHTLLAATLEHLRELKANGVKFVPVANSTLAALAAPAPRIIPMPAPTPPSPPPAPHAPSAAAPSPIIPMTTPAPTTAPRTPLTPRSPGKEQGMTELRARVCACTKCPNLAASRQQVVFGVGTWDAELMFIGEAPGADEDEQGEPFVGKAGQLLTKIITAMGLSRETVYIANILKCRPDTPGQSAGNRKPTAQEMSTCSPYLLEQIKLIQPKVLVALGATAAEGLLGKPVAISKLRGHWQTFLDIPLMPTYHPAYLLRNQALTEKRKVWEDMLQVLTKLGAPISDKQQGYFLK